MELTKPVELVAPKVEIKKEEVEENKEIKDVSEPKEEEEAKPVKKPRAMVETDIFDFSDIKVVNKAET